MAVGNSSYPGQVDTLDNLGRAANNVESTLAFGLTSTGMSLQLVSSAAFPASGILTIDVADPADATATSSEIVFYTSKEGNTLTLQTRGADGTQALAWAAGARVNLRPTARHHNVLAEAIILTQTEVETKAATSALDAKLDKAGGTLTGALTLAGAPTAALHAATKAYVDASAAGGGGDVTSVFGRTGVVTAQQSDYDAFFLTQAEGDSRYRLLATPLAISDTTGLQAALNAKADDTEITTINTALAGKLDRSGGTMTGAITLAGAPTADLHAATKKYVDDATVGGGSVSSVFGRSGAVTAQQSDYDSFFLTQAEGDTRYRHSATPLAISDTAGLQAALDSKAATTTVNTALALKLDKAGGTMTGAITLAGAPTVDLHAATKKYVDDATLAAGAVTSVFGRAGAVTAQQSDYDAFFLTQAEGDGRYRQTATPLAISDTTGLQAALDGKAPLAHVHAGADITTGTVAAARLGSGTANATTVLYGDNVWRTAGVGGGAPGGSGSEIQFRSGASTFGAVTGSSVSGADMTLAGDLNVTAAGTVSVISSDATVVLQNTSTAGYSGFHLVQPGGNIAGSLQYWGSTTATFPDMMVFGPRLAATDLIFTTGVTLTERTRLAADGTWRFGVPSTRTGVISFAESTSAGLSYLRRSSAALEFSNDGTNWTQVGAGGGGVTQGYVDAADAQRVLKAGDTVTGSLILNSPTVITALDVRHSGASRLKVESDGGMLFYDGTALRSVSVGINNTAGTGNRALSVPNLLGTSPLLEGLVAYWKLDEASGVRADSAGNIDLQGNNAPEGEAGKINNSTRFHGTSQHYLFNNSSPLIHLGPGSFTISAWFKLASEVFPGELNGIVSKWYNDVAEYAVHFRGDGDTVEFVVSPDGSNANSNAVAVGAGSIGVNWWYHVIAWHDADANTINISLNNGTPVSAAHTTGVAVGQWPPLEIGRHQGGHLWNGWLDEIGMWSRVLTAQERTDLYNGDAGVTYPFGGGTPPSYTIAVEDVEGLDDALDAKVSKAGDAMTGALTLPGAPTQNLHAATKAYVDGATGLQMLAAAYCAETIGSSGNTASHYEVVSYYPGTNPLNPWLYEAIVSCRETAGGSYLWADGYGGAHAILWGTGSSGPNLSLTGNFWTGSASVSLTTLPGHGVWMDEWVHLAVSWTRNQYVTAYVNGIPEAITGGLPSSASPGGAAGCGMLYFGGSDHNNWPGRILFARAFFKASEADLPYAIGGAVGGGGRIESCTFRPQLFPSPWGPGFESSQSCYTFSSHEPIIPDTAIAPLNGSPRPAKLGPGGINIVQDTNNPVVRAQQVGPYASFIYPLPAGVTPPTPPGGAVIFDSFTRPNQTFFNCYEPVIGVTEVGNKTWSEWGQENRHTNSPAILNGRLRFQSKRNNGSGVVLDTGLTGSCRLELGVENLVGAGTPILNLIFFNSGTDYIQITTGHGSGNANTDIYLRRYVGNTETDYQEITNAINYSTLKLTRSGSDFTIFGDTTQIFSAAGYLNSAGLQTGATLQISSSITNYGTGWDCYDWFAAYQL